MAGCGSIFVLAKFRNSPKNFAKINKTTLLGLQTMDKDGIQKIIIFTDKKL